MVRFEKNNNKIFTIDKAEKMISVIVPVYNSDKYLDQCIQSILAQTYADFELLMIDDGSTDSSASICDKYASQDSRVRVFHKFNGGVSSARNVGLDIAKGEWIAFCDSDDYVQELWLEAFVSGIKESDLVCQSINVLKDDKKFDYYHMPTCNIEKPNEIIFALMSYWQMLGSVYNKLFNANIIKQNGLRFREDIKYCEDEEFVTRYLRYVSKMFNIDKGGYNYRYMYNGKYDDIDVFPILTMIYKNVQAIPGISQKELKLFQKDLINNSIASLGKKSISIDAKLGHIVEYFRICGKESISVYAIQCLVLKLKDYIKKIL